MKTADDLRNVEKSLKQIGHLDNINLSLDKKSLTFDLSPSTTTGLDEIQKRIEKDTGLLTVLKGFGNTVSAVSEVHSDYSNIKNSTYSVEDNRPVIGVLRLTQLFNTQCFVDAVIDNLNDNLQPPFSVNINEYGDLSGKEFENVGDPKINLIHNLPAVQKASTRFNRVIEGCDLSDCIGRSIVISNRNKRPIAGGIVARASPVSGRYFFV